MCIYVGVLHMSAVACGIQNSVSHPLELELQEVMSHLGSNLSPLQEQYES